MRSCEINLLLYQKSIGPLYTLRCAWSLHAGILLVPLSCFPVRFISRSNRDQQAISESPCASVSKRVSGQSLSKMSLIYIKIKMLVNISVQMVSHKAKGNSEVAYFCCCDYCCCCCRNCLKTHRPILQKVAIEDQEERLKRRRGS